MGNNRNYNLQVDTYDENDYLFGDLLKEKEIQLPESVDLRNKMPAIMSQNGESSCTANAGVACLECLEYLLNNKKTILSRQYLYNKERINDGDINLSQDAGSSMRQICNTLKQNGCAEELFLKYSEGNLSILPSSEADKNADIYKITSYHRILTDDKEKMHYEIKQALAQGFPILFGCLVYPSFEEVNPDGKIRMPNIKIEKVLGAHATLLCGYKLTKELISLSSNKCILKKLFNIFKNKAKINIKNNIEYIQRNSWGTGTQDGKDPNSDWGYAYDNPNDSGWGDNGYGYLPEDVLDVIKQDIWVITGIKKIV